MLIAEPRDYGFLDLRLGKGGFRLFVRTVIS
jgi:hypothetical protein